ncbi:MAG: peptide-methionine (S)-S-oxide reductase MsrA [Bacteroidia bacterium]|nr:peptide-methionine (S)-S-oxide reductase MsrA [Bacteroidia bacterium]
MALSTATFGNGCFWCTEAIFQRIAGVHTVVSGYTGGKVKNPTYREVCYGRTGHAEVIQISFDPEIVSFEKLLEIFWKTHDPTTLNRQGNDVGTQYRSAVFYHDEKQKQLAEHYKAKLDASGIFADPIVTEITPISEFYPAEDYHQNYFNENGNQPYCRVIIQPKVEKFLQVFGE